MRKRALSMLLILCMVITLLPTTVFAAGSSSPEFSDVNPGDWYYDSVVYANTNGLMNGIGGDLFGPNDDLTRAMFITILGRMDGVDTSKYPTVDLHDVEGGMWYTSYIGWGVSEGIIYGYENGNFGTNDPITREQMATIIARYVDAQGIELHSFSNAVGGFNDASAVSDYAVDGLELMRVSGIIKGDNNNNFNPKNTATRAEAATIFMRLDEAINTEDEEVTYTVSFNTNGGSEISSQKVKMGEKAVKPANPTRSNYSFDGWYSDSALSKAFSFDTVIDADITLYAKWATATSGGSSGGSSGGGSSGGGNGNNSDDNVTYTKGEWIQLLANKLGFDLSLDLDDLDCFYGDTQESTYGLAIEIAEAYGILPYPDSDGYEDPDQDIPLFNPNAVATREFAAYTAVTAMGFIGEYSISCTDAASLEYPNEDAVAIQQGFLSLQNNYFLPNSALSTADKNSIFAAIDALNDSTNIDISNPYENVTYADGVIVDTLETITNYTVVMNSDDTISVTLPKNSATSAIQSDDVFVLPANDDFIAGIALKAISITDNENGTLTIFCSEPELSEVLSELQFVGAGTADVNGFIVSDGVACAYDPYGSIDDDDGAFPLNISAGGSVKVPGTLKFTVDKKLSEDVKAKGTISIEIPDITCKVDASIGLLSGVKLNELLISITEKIKLSGNIEYTYAESGYELTNGLGNTRWAAGKVELGRLPVALGTTGLSIDVVFFYNVDVKGTASITYTLVATQGIQYRNGATRTIADYSQSIDAISLKGSAKAGVGVAIRLNAFGLMDLIGVDGHLGLGAQASFTAHLTTDSTLYCGDGAIYCYLTIELDTDTAFGLFLKKVCHITYSWEVWKEDNSPFKLKLHFENGVKVSKCTFGAGSIAGYVYEAGGNRTLANARVSIYNGNTLVKTLYTNSSGYYSLHSLSAGEYTVKVSATGYQTYTDTVTVKKDQTTHMEILLMVDRSGTGSGSVSGNITDAVTGFTVSSVEYNVRANWSNTTGTILKNGTAQNGTYSIDMPAGNYTIEFIKGDYITSYVNIAIQASATTTKHVALVPESAGAVGDNIRIVLTWGLMPYDLDSHLYGPTVDGTSTFHTYFVNKNYTYGGNTIANLDRDDTDSYGPETTTIYELNSSGVYSFYVHDYTNKSSNSSSALSMSGAQVKVYSSNMLIATFNIPTNQAGTIWHVFDYDASSDSLTPVNTFANSDTPGDIRPNTQSFMTFGAMSLFSYADKDELSSLVEWVNANLDPNEAQTKILREAESIIANPNATQDAVNMMIDTLHELFDDSIEMSVNQEVDTTDLEDLILTAKRIDTSLYTEDSVSALLENIYRAEILITNTSIAQDQVEAMIAELQNSIDQLVEIFAE